MIYVKKTNADGGDLGRNSLEDNLKKAMTELLVLFLFSEREHYIGELSTILSQRSKGALSVVFPYAAIYRISRAGYLVETQKRTAPDGRLRQYYGITEEGREYLHRLLGTYREFFRGVEDVLSGEEVKI